MKDMSVPIIEFTKKTNWETYRIGNLCDILTGFPFPGDKIKDDGTYLLMRGINITEGIVRHSDDIDRYYDGSTIGLEKYFLHEGDLVIGLDGSKVGKNSALVTAYESSSLLVQRVARLRNKDLDIIRLIQIAIKSSKFIKYIDEIKTSSAIPHISPEDIKSFRVSLPTASQIRSLVVSYFQSLDSLIQTTEKKIASLKQVKEASLQAMFPAEGETVPKVRFKGFEGEWKNMVIGEAGNTFSGLIGKNKLDFGVGEAQYITFLNVLNNAQIDTDILEFVNVSNDEHQNYVRIGDLFFNTSSETPDEVGMCSVLTQDVRNVYLNSFCFGFRISDSSVCPEYISYLMRGPVGRRIMSVLAQGATRFNLSKNNFLKASIPCPQDYTEQRKIASYFIAIDKQISVQKQRLEKLKQIKSACLDAMFV